jgi:hypothetical protein
MLQVSPFRRSCGFPNLIRLNALKQCRCKAQNARVRSEGCRMLDIVMLAIGLGFFTLSVCYTFACDRL